MSPELVTITATHVEKDSSRDVKVATAASQPNAVEMDRSHELCTDEDATYVLIDSGFPSLSVNSRIVEYLDKTGKKVVETKVVHKDALASDFSKA